MASRCWSTRRACLTSTAPNWISSVRASTKASSFTTRARKTAAGVASRSGSERRYRRQSSPLTGRGAAWGRALFMSQPTMTAEILIRPERPDHPKVRPMLAELDAYLASLYEPEANHILDVQALLAPE